jgi:hypothetical protein
MVFNHRKALFSNSKVHGSAFGWWTGVLALDPQLRRRGSAEAWMPRRVGSVHEPVTKQHPVIDLEEFEKRLRGPLAELARLIDGQQDSVQSVAEPQGQFSTEARQDISESVEPKRPGAMEHLIGGDLASIGRAKADSIEAELLGATRSAAATPSEAKELETPESYGLLNVAGDTTACQDFPTLNEEIRSRRPLYIMAAIAFVGMVGIGASLGFRSGVSRPPEIAPISENGSAKRQLEATNRSGVPSPDSSIPGAAPQPSPGAVVNNATQPLEPLQLRETMPAIVAEDASSTLRPDNELAAKTATIAAPPERIETPVDPASQTVPIDPKKMNTAAVGQNDEILSSEAPPRSAAKIVPMPVPRPGAVAKASAPKTAARVATPKPAAKPKRGTSTVTAQPMQQATSQGGGREPDPLGDLLRGLFGNVPEPWCDLR